jgi:hypothetical protein
MFVPPFQMPLLIQVDPSMRAALQIGSAQTFGIAVGPIAASRLTTATSVAKVAGASVSFFVVSWHPRTAKALSDFFGQKLEPFLNRKPRGPGTVST